MRGKRGEPITKISELHRLAYANRNIVFLHVPTGVERKVPAKKFDTIDPQTVIGWIRLGYLHHFKKQS